MCYCIVLQYHTVRTLPASYLSYLSYLYIRDPLDLSPKLEINFQNSSNSFHSSLILSSIFKISAVFCRWNSNDRSQVNLKFAPWKFALSLHQNFRNSAAQNLPIKFRCRSDFRQSNSAVQIFANQILPFKICQTNSAAQNLPNKFRSQSDLPRRIFVFSFLPLELIFRVSLVDIFWH